MTTAHCDTHGDVPCPRCVRAQREVGRDGPTARLRRALRRGKPDAGRLVLAVYGEDTPHTRQKLRSLRAQMMLRG